VPLSSPAPGSRWLSALCLASVFWAFSFGSGAPLASVWLRDRDCSETLVGLNTGTYYLGIALAAGLIPWMMRRWGRPCLVVGMVVSGVSVACFPLSMSPVAWFALRAVNGVAGAMTLIPLETLVNRLSAPEQRARNFGFYAFSVALGMALGTLLVQWYPVAPTLVFMAGGAVSVVLGTVALFWLPVRQGMEEEAHEHAPLAFGRNFLSFGSAWSQGFLEGGMVGFLLVYLLASDFSAAQASGLMSGIMIGVILFQVPIAWLADRLGRTNVLVGCTIVVALGLGLLPFAWGRGDLSVGLFLVGACSGAFYPLGLALLGERLPSSGLARANAWYLAINCVGSLTGPVVAGIAMDAFGKQALLMVGEAAVVAVLAAWLGTRLFYRTSQVDGAAAHANEISDQHAA
jgi:MFS family permease